MQKYKYIVVYLVVIYSIFHIEVLVLHILHIFTMIITALQYSQQSSSKGAGCHFLGKKNTETWFLFHST